MGKKRKKKIFETPEEYAAWKAHHDEGQRRLYHRIALIQAELAAKQQKQEPA